jgi:monofunctional chorismate mutase
MTQDQMTDDGMSAASRTDSDKKAGTAGNETAAGETTTAKASNAADAASSEANKRARAELTAARQKIDRIDKQLVVLLCERMEVVSELSTLKQQAEMPILDVDREQQKIDAIAELTAPQYRIYLKSLFGDIMDEAKAFQEYQREQDSTPEPVSRTEGPQTLEESSIIIIGMPSCGKSSVGQRIADLLGKDFIDVDAEIARREGCSIPDIFARGGEPEFRRVETEVTTDIANSHRGSVISCGGGVVTQSRNYAPLHETGYIVRLQRPLEFLKTDGRPMSQLKGNAQLLKERDHLYRAWADATVDNTGTVDQAAQAAIAAAKAHFGE